MKVLRLLHMTFVHGFYAWAMKEIQPLHPDVPQIVVRQREIRDTLNQLWS